jgi:hypothetical protein
MIQRSSGHTSLANNEFFFSLTWLIENSILGSIQLDGVMTLFIPIDTN